MARPTKEQQAQKDELKKKFKRDSIELQIFEITCQRVASEMKHDCFMAYVMTYAISKIQNIFEESIIWLLSVMQYPNITLPYQFILTYSWANANIKIDPESLMHHLTDPNSMMQKCRTEPELLKDFYQNAPLISFQEQLKVLQKSITKEEVNNLSPFQRIPIFTRLDSFLRESSEIGHKVAAVNLDFSKPKEELLAIVSKLKDDFDNDPSIVQHADVLSGLTKEKNVYLSKQKEDELYKKNKSKPLEGKYADTLFIYACHINGLEKEYAIDEINRYWNDVKRQTNDKMTPRTHKQYLEHAKSLASGEHLNFTTGEK